MSRVIGYDSIVTGYCTSTSNQDVTFEADDRDYVSLIVATYTNVAPTIKRPIGVSALDTLFSTTYSTVAMLVGYGFLWRNGMGKTIGIASIAGACYAVVVGFHLDGPDNSDVANGTMGAATIIHTASGFSPASAYTFFIGASAIFSTLGNRTASTYHCNTQPATLTERCDFGYNDGAGKYTSLHVATATSTSASATGAYGCTIASPNTNDIYCIAMRNLNPMDTAYHNKVLNVIGG